MTQPVSRLLPILLLALCLLLPAPLRAEVDDSSLFMDAFNAFQRKDYLLSVEKLNLLNQQFPDSPLRDVSLLMLARSYQRSGEYDPAARTINQFSAEFGTSTLAGSVDEELLHLGKRQKAGEKLVVNKQLHAAAQKVRHDQLAIERAAAERAERERLAREKAERERIAHEKAEAERRERERLAAIKAARDAIKFGIEPPAAPVTITAATLAQLPFELVNHGVGTEEFSVSATASLSGEVTVLAAGGAPLQKVTLKPKERLKGIVTVKVPGDKVDGAKVSAEIKVASTKFNDLIQTQTVAATVSAPLLRAVTRYAKSPLAIDEKTSYRVTVLNVGSQAAKDVDLRITLPSAVKLVDAGENGCWIESEQVAACRIETIPQGMLTERTLQVQAKTVAPAAQRGTVEVVQTVLQVKESFPGAAATTVNVSKK